MSKHAKKSLEMMKNLGLLEPIKVLLEKDASFKATLMHWASKNANVGFLFDLIDMDLSPIAGRLDFLSARQQSALRRIIERPGVDYGWASDFIDALKQPGKVLDTPAIMRATGLKGGAMRQIMDFARDLMLKNPRLADNGSALTQEIIHSLV